MLNTTPVTRHGTTEVHVHRRDDWRPCPSLFPAPLRPTKPAAIWFFGFAVAVQHHETMVDFVNEHPAEFPRLAGTS